MDDLSTRLKAALHELETTPHLPELVKKHVLLGLRCSVFQKLPQNFSGEQGSTPLDILMLPLMVGLKVEDQESILTAMHRLAQRWPAHTAADYAEAGEVLRLRALSLRQMCWQRALAPDSTTFLAIILAQMFRIRRAANWKGTVLTFLDIVPDEVARPGWEGEEEPGCHPHLVIVDTNTIAII